ncbi:hypothetical protein [Streptomyces brasiliensis]|uniref:Uncharacterized protein n=1 Tax=Streptomyces brasiliensis TaxID=1954 RepID=A0A917UIW4_9ACTN|nr:hypothetical protein [Streptomyces brasiliensis]GGJ61358.1 hypothetical protein GCM10010121_084910 [Streptomyces brasiliensis]
MLVPRRLAAKSDPRTLMTDPHATYFGAELQETTLLPGPDAHIAAPASRTGSPSRRRGLSGVALPPGPPRKAHAFVAEPVAEESP